jgi:L-amino acid N-acyltransferase YncA
MTIRTAAAADAAEIVAYMADVGGESDNLTFGAGELDLTVDKETKLLADLYADGRSVMLLGLLGGELACASALRCSERPRVRHNAEFSITVRRKYWNLGAGDALMSAVVDYARVLGDIKNIHLGVRVGNDSAIHLYEKHGFVNIGTEKRSMYFGGEYHDSYLMDLYL